MTAERVELKAVDAENAEERKRVVDFVNSYYPSQLPVREGVIRSGAILFFWAYDNQSGQLIGITGYMPKTPYLAEGVKTVIAPEQRGKGWGAALSWALEHEVRRAGYKKLMSTILIDNLPMIFIKLKQGFIVEGIHMDHEKPGLHEYSLGKILR